MADGTWRGADAEAPLRGELLSAERLAERARELAAMHASDEAVPPRVSLRRVLDRADDELDAFNVAMATDAREGRPINPSIEWMLDNHYLIEEQVRRVREDLPAGYGSELPRLASGPYAGMPRVFEIAVTLVEHTDARIDRDYLVRFVNAYQDVQPLTIGETWAVPIMLRMALVENLRRLARGVGHAQEGMRSADDRANALVEADAEGPEAVRAALAALRDDPHADDSAFLVRLAQRVRGVEAAPAMAEEWLETRLADSGGLEEVVGLENRRQAADQVSIANSITSVRFLTALDWREFFEAASLVEHTLRADPAGVYERMDFQSRDRYRHSLEELAKRSPHTELEIAEACVSWSLEGIERDPSDIVRGHVGYYLISDGRYALEGSLHYRPRVREKIYRGPLRYRSFLFWGTLSGLGVGLVALLGLLAMWNGAGPAGVGLLMLLGAVPLSELAVSLTDRLAQWLWPARLLSKLDAVEELAEAHRALVVVPTLLGSVDGVQHAFDEMEVAYLANRDPNVHFCLLADLRAAGEETAAADGPLLEAARVAVERLNERHGEGPGPFHLLIRRRTWNPVEGSWMGWERKRGALVDLNRLLRGTPDSRFVVREGDASFLTGVTFVLTLDADTLLPRDTARRLVCTIAHPLNRAAFDPVQRRVVRGYGLVQPRVGMTVTSSARSLFAWLHTGDTGVDPYAGAVSNTYQDVFGEGSFTGKGIYEVDVFQAALDDRIPENLVLSHDLLEGNFARTALASDVEVFDEYPSSYFSQAVRLHRWVRGDWQTVPWLMSRVPTERGGTVPNPLSALHRWKLVDNLRRSLVAPATLLLAVAAWPLLPGPAWWFLAVLFGAPFVPVLLGVLDAVRGNPPGADLGLSVQAMAADLRRDTTRIVLELSTLPHRAQLMADAIVRATWRMRVSHVRLLEWETAAEAEARAALTQGGYWRHMGPSVIVSLLALGAAIARDPDHLMTVVPLVALWLSGPVVAFRAGLPSEPPQAEPSAEERAFTRALARRTWRFFDTFVTADDHWLAPDNFQEEPKGEVAHRTSPTNVGLQLLANLVAYDLGYASLSGLVERTSRTMQTLVGLERFRGHFYNWYDTLTLQPLRPQYVSTVDSGNLAGELVALRVGLLEASERPLVGPQVLEGLADTVRLAMADLAEAVAADTREEVAGVRESLGELLRRLTLEEPPADVGAWRALLARFVGAASALPDRLPSAAESTPALAAARNSVEAVAREASEHLADLDEHVPWASLVAEAPAAARTSPALAALQPLLGYVPSLAGLAEGLPEALAALAAAAADPPGADAAEREAMAAWSAAVLRGIEEARPSCVHLLARLRLMTEIARETWGHMDFGLLYDPSRELFSIGFNLAEGRLDNSYYDLLASECRLASFLAVASGQVPQEHWFRLGRTLTPVPPGGRALLSWSASMFEYLMPLLLMRTWPGTLLDATCRAVVRRQEEYGLQRGVPWGVSESGFNAKDVELTYQYQAFGVPGLGLKRGLSEDVVIAPYATVLATQVDLSRAVANLRVLRDEGAEGRYGFYEALDYTPGRVPAGARRAVVRAYFAHHQGMSLLALANVLTGSEMVRRFHTDPLVQSAELLLQERVPRHTPVARPHVEEVRFVRSVRELPPPVDRSYPTAHTPVPSTHFLSNGRYSVMVTNAGGGYSRWEGLSVTRYREDVTRDCWGTFFYIRDVEAGRVWSAGFQPTSAEADDYHVTFSADKAEYRRRDGDVETHTEVVVSPEDDVEVRRLTIANRGRRQITLDVTSYLEVALAPQGADQAHRAYSNLFVETEHVPGLDALLFTRRPRSTDEDRTWGLHVIACERATECEASFETDRARFIGRLRTVATAAALDADAELSGTAGPVLDPACALRKRIVLDPGETEHVAFTTGVARTRDDAVRLAEKYRDVRSAQRAMDMAWTSSQIELRDLGITPDEAVMFQRLGSRLLLTDPYSRLKVKTPLENTLPMSGLWGLGISGDLPLLLVKVDRLEETPLARQALLAHQYWRHKGLVSDLVVLNTHPSAYSGEIDARLRTLVRTGQALQLLDRPGGVFLRAADQIDPATLNLLESVARAVLVGDRGPILLQLNQRATRPEAPDALVPKAPVPEWEPVEFERPPLVFDNGFGGFDPDTGEYVVVLEDGDATPAPWVNVMANPDFGTMISEAGIGCSWALNSHENRITTWNNDPVSDGSGEALYVRDEETGEFWSPTLLPACEPGPHVIRHGRGYTRFSHEGHGVRHEVTWTVPPADPLRVVRLTLTNTSGRPRYLSVTHLVEWVLGDSRSRANQRVATWWDDEHDLLFAINWFNLDFPGRKAFLATDRAVHSFTASRTEFIGRNGHPARPAAMGRKGLGGQVGRFHDNCGALMVRVTLEPGESESVTFLLGQTATEDEARELVARYRSPGEFEATLQRTGEAWEELVGCVRASTPDAALDLLVNGWLLYQVLSSRMWGRTALYQSSGAFGFRDQLQDGLALLLSRPAVLRAQILEAAAHQFEEGDAMHWWMPATGRGVRTHFMDDRHWLPYATARYLDATGDTGLLAEEVPFVIGAPLPPEQEDAYFQPAEGRVAPVYEHCVRALDLAPLGPHGLPLIGGGDWNDGMNRVGHEGRGESVWLGWFLIHTLRAFAPVAEARGDASRAEEYRRRADELSEAVERDGWDGSWYRRAYFDDGTPLGSRENEECRIDAIAQAWATIAGGRDRMRAQRALESVEGHLVSWEDGLIKLLHPPFDKTPHDPGYIKGYVPGVRENGGQYTHAAVWVVLAYLLQGDGDEALALFDLINPVNHSRDRAEAERYRVEPYVVAADVYAAPPHVGRGGWTWYTGSASWFYQVATGNVLGLRTEVRDGARVLVIDPCVPKSWERFSMVYRVHGTEWHIEVRNPRGVNRGVARVVVDGADMPGLAVPLTEDGGRHDVTVTLLGG